jgi:spore germination cell wall hydrolase CwlJ-like protein
MEISLKPKPSVYVNLTAKTLKVVGLSLVLWAVAQVCLQKLEYLKQNKIGLDANYVTAAEKTKQLECLTKNIYWEAASEPFEGKVGVAQVTMNRVESGKFASSVCGVVYQKNVFYEKVVCQFSWYCENVSKIRPIHKEMWKESEEVAKKVLLENFRLPSLKNALYYHADYVNPGWQKPKIDKIGRHIFYGEKNAI